MDITIKNVPTGAEDKVKEMAMIAIERFKKQSLVVPPADVATFETEVDTILVANGLDKKYEKMDQLWQFHSIHTKKTKEKIKWQL